MQLISNGKQLSSLLVKLASNHSQLSFAVAWASYETNFFRYLIASEEHRSKINHSTVGVHFYQTDPRVLEEFIDCDYFRVVLNPSGVFHPKIYYFYSDSNKWDLVIGSANMTKGAFEKNLEICMHISSSDAVNSEFSEKTVTKQLKFLWNDGKIITQEIYDEYLLNYCRRRLTRDKLLSEYLKSSVRNTPTLVSTPWEDFHQLVLGDKTHSVEDRCKILNLAKEQFAKYSFRNMSALWRRAIAGIVSYGPDSYGLDWGYFGDMNRGKYYTRYITNENNAFTTELSTISQALDCIPNDRAVTYEDYNDYIQLMQQAFRHGGIRLPRVTRLLALKRPDYFVCLDSKNKERVCFELGIEQSVLDGENMYEHYWHNVIVQIQQSHWWKSTKPTNNDDFQLDIWNGRAAMLDAIFYVP